MYQSSKASHPYRVILTRHLVLWVDLVVKSCVTRRSVITGAAALFPTISLSTSITRSQLYVSVDLAPPSLIIGSFFVDECCVVRA